MKSMTRLALFLFFAASTLANEQQRDARERWRHIQGEEQNLQQEGWIILRTQQVAPGPTLIYAATREQALRNPRWDGRNDPPLGLGKAIEIAEDHVRKQLSENEQLRLSSITAEQIYVMSFSNRFDNRWYYVIVLMKRIPEEKNVKGWTAEGVPPVYVLMDGTVIEPKVVRE